MKAQYSDPNTGKYLACGVACADASCISACNDKYPTVWSKVEAATNCKTTKCPC
ncbi:MAG: hypothetical protein KC776_03080 [Myxococcales bacterium]|nr:hypothetical protein [Myxococcales bacterium]MCB9582541.1 hypothetical protein [Polyangiaceae bacterium]